MELKKIRKTRRWNPSVSLEPAEFKIYQPGDNYKSVSRYKPLLCGYLEAPEPTRYQQYFCKVCGMVLKRELKKKVTEKRFSVIESAWSTSEELKPQDPQYQAIFDEWWNKVTHTRKEEPGLMKHPQQEKKVVPHHIYHHKFCEKKEQPPQKKDQTVICADCPDPHRPWKRGKAHPYNPCPVHYPLSEAIEEAKPKQLRLLVNLHSVKEMKKQNTKITEEEIVQRRNSKILKQSLSGIIRNLIGNKGL